MGRNWQWSYERGRALRLEAERLAFLQNQPVALPPLHSLDGTMQSKFEQGWDSPTPVEIQRYINPPQSIGQRLRASQSLRTILGI